LLQDREVAVGIFPKRKEILIGGFGSDLISRESTGSPEFQMRACAYRVGEYDARVVEDPLEFPGGYGISMR
jgi:hypothetical protein